MSGWFAMKRGIHEHPIFHRNPQRLFVWSWMLATAAWKDTRQNANGKIITVKRGQLLTSYSQVHKATGVGVQVIRTLVSMLEKEHAIQTDTNTGRMLITIENYDKYQSPARGDNTAPTREQHASNTQKEQENHITNPPTEGAASPPVRLTSIKRVVWSLGKEYLGAHGIPNPGSLIGKWLKVTDAASLLTAIEAAEEAETQDPVPYITAILEGSNGRGHSASRAADERFNATLEQIARTAGLGEA